MVDVLFAMHFRECIELCDRVWRDGMAKGLEVEGIPLRGMEYSGEKCWETGKESLVRSGRR